MPLLLTFMYFFVLINLLAQKREYNLIPPSKKNPKNVLQMWIKFFPNSKNTK